MSEEPNKLEILRKLQEHYDLTDGHIRNACRTYYVGDYYALVRLGSYNGRENKVVLFDHTEPGNSRVVHRGSRENPFNGHVKSGWIVKAEALDLKRHEQKSTTPLVTVEEDSSDAEELIEAAFRTFTVFNDNDTLSRLDGHQLDALQDLRYTVNETHPCDSCTNLGFQVHGQGGWDTNSWAWDDTVISPVRPCDHCNRINTMEDAVAAAMQQLSSYIDFVQLEDELNRYQEEHTA